MVVNASVIVIFDSSNVYGCMVVFGGLSFPVGKSPTWMRITRYVVTEPMTWEKRIRFWFFIWEREREREREREDLEILYIIFKDLILSSIFLNP